MAASCSDCCDGGAGAEVSLITHPARPYQNVTHPLALRVSQWYDEGMVFLTDDEALDLIRTILEAVEAAESGAAPARASWAMEAEEWCLLIADRLNQGGES